MTAIDQIGKTVPNVILDTVILNRSTIVLRMHINEYLYDADTGTWFTNDNYKEKLQIRIKVKTESGESFAYVSCANAEIDRLKIGQQQKIYYNIILRQGESETAAIKGAPIGVDNPTGDPFFCENLTISAETFISAEKLSPPINFGSTGFVELGGKSSTVTVIKNYESQTRTVGYFLGNTFYTGPKTQLANGRWVTGNVQDESSEFLIERNVPNIKVMDNRDVYESDSEINELLLYPSAMEKNEPSAPYFSPLSATRDTNGILRFLFTFDYRKTYSKNSLYGATFDNLSDTLQDRVLLMSTLQMLSLKRQRIGASFTNLPIESVVTSGEPSGDRFVDINNDQAALKEEEFNFQKGTLHLRTFSGTDKLFGDISSGDFEYSVEVRFKDGIYQFLSFQLNDLNVATTELAKYIDSLETYENGMLREDFIEQVKAENDFLNRPYIRALISLSENIYFYNARRPKKLINSIRNWLSPVTSTRDSINAAHDMMVHIQGNLDELLSVVRQDASEATTQGESRGHLVYDVQELFNQTFDASDTFKNGLTFLSATEILESTDSDGLVKVSSSDFEKRIENENISFFNSKDATFSIDGAEDSLSSTSKTTSFTYLTPTAVRLNNQIFAVGTIKNLKSTQGVDVEALSLGDSKSKYKSILSQLRTSRVTDSGLGSETLDIAPISDPDFETVAPTGEPDPSSSVADTIHDFSYAINAESYDNPFANLQLLRIIPGANGDTIELTGIAGDKIQMTRKQFDLLPNYFKAILSGAQSFGNSYSDIFAKAENGDIDPYSLIIGSTVKIEVLIDYEKNAAPVPQYLVRKPKWVPLTYELYRAQAGTNLLCRLAKYDNPAIGFVRSNNAAVYNHFFVLESPTISTIYGTHANGLQTDINGARSLSDLIDIFSNYGIDYDPSGSDGLEITIGADGCAALVDEQSVEDMTDDNI